IYFGGDNGLAGREVRPLDAEFLGHIKCDLDHPLFTGLNEHLRRRLLVIRGDQRSLCAVDVCPTLHSAVPAYRESIALLPRLGVVQERRLGVAVVPIERESYIVALIVV